MVIIENSYTMHSYLNEYRWGYMEYGSHHSGGLYTNFHSFSSRWSFHVNDDKPAYRKKAGKYEVLNCLVPVPLSFSPRQVIVPPPTFSPPKWSKSMFFFLPRSHA